MGHEHRHHEHGDTHDAPGDKTGVTFNYEGTNYTISLAVAENAGLVRTTDRIQVPGGQLILLHPHAHEDNANTVRSIEEGGGKVWQVE